MHCWVSSDGIAQFQPMVLLSLSRWHCWISADVIAEFHPMVIAELQPMSLLSFSRCHCWVSAADGYCWASAVVTAEFQPLYCWVSAADGYCWASADVTAEFQPLYCWVSGQRDIKLLLKIFLQLSLCSWWSVIHWDSHVKVLNNQINILLASSLTSNCMDPCSIPSRNIFVLGA